MAVEAGQRFSYERTFTREDVEAFAEVSGDRGVHHMQPDSKGRIMLQGLLTATLPTKMGGDMNYIARKISFDFVRPVYVGDTVRAEAVVKEVTRAEGYFRVAIDIVCVNQNGEEVLRGWTEGVIRTQENPPRERDHSVRSSA